MTKFKVGDKVRMTAESIEFYEDIPIDLLSGYEWDAIYTGPLTIAKVYRDGEDRLYELKETKSTFHEFELEED